MVIRIDPNEYPFSGEYIKLRGHDYHYLDEGEGEPIVMVHGNPTWSFYFRRAVKAFSKNYRTIAPDHIGCGLSGRPSASDYRYTLEQRIDDLEALLDHLSIRSNITLMVHDWGGMIGMGYAARYPERIRRLIITNTAAFHLPESVKFPWTLKLCRNKYIGQTVVQGLNAFNWGAARYCAVRGKLSPEIRAAYLTPYDSWENRRAIYNFVADIPLSPTDASFQTVSDIECGLATLASKPMLICWGARDFIFNDGFLMEWKKRFPNATILRVPQAGHYLFEDAWEDVQPSIASFLRETSDAKIDAR